MLELKNTLTLRGLRQADLHRSLGISGATLSLLINKNEWPKTMDHDDLKTNIRSFLLSNGATAEQAQDCFKPATMCLSPLPPVNKKSSEEKAKDKTKEPTEEHIMLLRKQTLSPDAKQAFGFTRDPFGEVREANEVFTTPQSRYVREAMRQTARHGGFVALVGESGAGKSTLRRDLIGWAAKDEHIIVIEPYVLGLEDNDMAGKTMRATHIAEAIMSKVAPHEKLPRSPETRFRMLHEALRESSRAGNSHVLIIEEAHGLPIPTLKHLKRFFELEDGFKKLLGIILIGQTELGVKLDERNPRVREIVQRCEVVRLQPLATELGDYLKHRFSLVGIDLATLMDEQTIEAVRCKLGGDGSGHSVTYPLAIHNVCIAAFNEAAAIGMNRLSPDLVLEV